MVLTYDLDYIEPDGLNQINGQVKKNQRSGLEHFVTSKNSIGDR